MYILADIGGTNMRVAISRTGEKIDDILKKPTPKEYVAGLEQLRVLVDEITKGEKLQLAIVGIAGPLTENKERLIKVPNLPLWDGKPHKKDIEGILRTQVILENDSALAGLGEAVYGAGKDQKIVAYMTISTGVGGARIVDKKIDQSAFGFEPGRQFIDAGLGLGKQSARSGKLREYVRGRSIEEWAGNNPRDIKDPEIWKEIARYISYGVHNICVMWSPNIIVLGGGVMNDVDIQEVRKNIQSSLQVFGGKAPIIEKAELKDDNGLYGALALLQEYKQK